ncbi:prepilin-type N-terminal cleavage/methylation domain-containing protein [Opitutaceae bacterium TAV1]|nr:prepilin-type N-terminal cleavage/methylation domain-containing protein [Opitutaceae bacterium TAV1]
MHTNQTCHHRRAFTLIELLAVIAIIGILAAILIPVVGLVRNKARASASISNLRQIFLAMSMFADENRDNFPIASGTVDWNLDITETDEMSWTQQLYPYTHSKDFFLTPRFERSGSAYFMGANAAYVRAGSKQAATNRSLIEYRSQFVLAGETNYGFGVEPDFDKDDYTQNCVNAPDTLFSDGTQAILFADGHVGVFKGYDPEKMTFRYDEIGPWQNPG